MNSNGVHFTENPNRGYGDDCWPSCHILFVAEGEHDGDVSVDGDHHQV